MKSGVLLTGIKKKSYNLHFSNKELDITTELASNFPGIVGVITMNDIDLAEHVRKKMPMGTYTSIGAKTLQYAFASAASTLPRSLDSRVIILDVTKKEKCSAFFAAFFSGLGFFEGTNYEGNLDDDQLKKELLSRICDVPGNVGEIEKAYARCTQVLLYIAKDLTASAIDAAYAPALKVVKVGELALRIAPIVLAAV